MTGLIPSENSFGFSEFCIINISISIILMGAEPNRV